MNERVSRLVFKLKKGYKLQLVEAYAPASSHDDQIVNSLYEDEEWEMSKVRAPYNVPMGDFNAKECRKQVSD